MKKYKFGFTISEMLVALAVIGILSLVLAPILGKMMPDQNKILIKRSYFLITNTVSKMLEDDTLYSPFGAVGSVDETTPIYANELFANKSAVNFNGNVYSGDTKFSGIFTEIIGAEDSGTVSAKPSFRRGASTFAAFLAKNCPVARSKDGIKWTFYTPSDSMWDTVASIITVDVNGDKAPNCYQGSYGGCKDRTKDFDQYVVAIYNDGKVQISLNEVWVHSIIDASGSFKME